jgi:hypothetical protein
VSEVTGELRLPLTHGIHDLLVPLLLEIGQSCLDIVNALFGFNGVAQRVLDCNFGLVRGFLGSAFSPLPQLRQSSV